MQRRGQELPWDDVKGQRSGGMEEWSLSDCSAYMSSKGIPATIPLNEVCKLMSIAWLAVHAPNGSNIADSNDDARDALTNIAKTARDRRPPTA